jgi:hypothetical protein
MTVATDPRKTAVTGGMTLLASSSAAGNSVTGTVTETALATITVPGGAMGLNGGVMILVTWTVTNSANNKVLRIRFGGAAGTAYSSVTVTTNATYSDMRRIRNRGATNSQVGGASGGANALGTSTTSVITSSLDTSVAQDIVLSAELANTGETITLQSYEVWLLP